MGEEFETLVESENDVNEEATPESVNDGGSPKSIIQNFTNQMNLAECRIIRKFYLLTSNSNSFQTHVVYTT